MDTHVLRAAGRGQLFELPEMMPARRAGRIAARPDRLRYDSFAMTLHWLTALLVLVQFGLGELWGFAPSPARGFMIAAHMSFGILLTLVLIVRIGWRLTPGHHVRDATVGWAHVASTGMQYALYALLAIEVVLGFLRRWSSGGALSFFGLPVPSPIPTFSKPMQHLLADAHGWVAWTIVILAVGHAFAALFHYFVLHDDVLGRMLPGRHPSRITSAGAAIGRSAPGAPDHTA